MRKFSTNINSTTDFYILCTTFRSIFFVSQYRKILLGNTSVYQKISGSEKFYASEEGEGVSRFSSKIFCLTVPKNFVGEPFSVSLISGTEKVWIRGGGYQDFPSKIFCLTVPKISVGESFTVAIISGIEKVWIMGGVSRFSVEVFVSLYRNISLENTFVFQKNSFVENFHA